MRATLRSHPLTIDDRASPHEVSNGRELRRNISCLPEIGGVFQSAPGIILAPLAPPSYLANHLARPNNVNCLFLIPAMQARAARAAAA